MFKICVIGCGAMSTSSHGPSFKKYNEDYDGVCLSACCDLDEEKAKVYQEKFGFLKYYTDYNEMLKKEQPDVVSLISPVKLTKELSIDIMKKGFNIILEKPPGATPDETKDMIKQAEESKVFVRTAFNRRYAPLILKLKENLKGKQIFNITYQMYRFSRKEATFYTTAIHAIDAVKNIVGSDYKKVNFSYQELSDRGEGVANFYLDCDFENGVKGQITLITNGGTNCERITVNTPDETYFVNLPVKGGPDSNGSFMCVKGREIIENISGSSITDTEETFEGMGLYEENRSFFELIKSGEDVTCDLESGIQSIEIASCLHNRKTVYEK